MTELRAEDAWEGVERAPVPRSRNLMALILLGHLALVVLFFDPKLHTGGDNAEYVSLAASILRPGDGYADHLRPGPPVPHTKYPPGFPLLLAPVLALFGGDVVKLKLVSLSAVAASTLVFFGLASRRLRPQIALLTALAFAVNPLAIDYSHWILSEGVFLLVTLGALLAFERDAEEASLGRWFALAVLLSIGSFYVRSIGVAVLAAGVFFYAVTRQLRKLGWFCLVGGGLTIPWVIRTWVHSGSTTPYMEEFLLESLYRPELGHLDVWGLAGRVADNVWIYGTREFPRALAGTLSWWAPMPTVRAAGSLIALIAVVTCIYRLWTRPRPMEAYVLASLAVILLFAQVVSDVRYLLPLIPLALLYFADGVTLLTARMRLRGGGELLQLAPLTVVAVFSLGAQAVRVPAHSEMLRQYRSGDPLAGYAPNWRGLFEAAEWVAQATPEDAVFTVRKPRLFHLLTGRYAMNYPFSSDRDVVLDSVMLSDYVVLDRVSSTTAEYLVPAIEQAEEPLTLVFRTPDDAVWVLQVPGAGAP